jgi:hypothetical protein
MAVLEQTCPRMVLEQLSIADVAAQSVNGPMAACRPRSPGPIAGTAMATGINGLDATTMEA